MEESGVTKKVLGASNFMRESLSTIERHRTIAAAEKQRAMSHQRYQFEQQEMASAYQRKLQEASVLRRPMLDNGRGESTSNVTGTLGSFGARGAHRGKATNSRLAGSLRGGQGKRGIHGVGNARAVPTDESPDRGGRPKTKPAGGLGGRHGESPKRGERPVTKPVAGLRGRLGKRNDHYDGNVGVEPLQDAPARLRAQLANAPNGGAPGCLGKSPTRGERPEPKPTAGLGGRPGKRNDHVHGNVGVELPRDAPAKARAQLVRKPKVARPGCPASSG